MNIKEQIGKRIFEARKEKGLTRKALAELTDDLKPSRINNWEHGIRTPGPEEIKQLSIALDISPSFLMCLSDQKESLLTPLNTHLCVPLINLKQACNPSLTLEAIKMDENLSHPTYISLHNDWVTQLGQHAFALKMPDESMEPEFRYNDILIVDPNKSPQPGNFVVAKINDHTEVIIRRYKEISPFKKELRFELLAMNNHWADLKDCTSCILIGTVCGFKRIF